MSHQPHDMTQGVAAVLGELATEIETLGGTLCSDPALVTAYMGQLQSIDLIAQKLNGLAVMLATDNPADELEYLRLDGLRERLCQGVSNTTA